MVVAFHKVIIVEEDPVEAGILEFYLDRAGVEAVTVQTTTEALRHVDPSTPYGVLTEAVGAEISWLELAEATLGYPSIFMILSDGPLSREEEVKALRHGVTEIFVKPADPKTVVEHLRLGQPVPLGSGSVGVPPEGFGGDFRTHHAQKLLQFSRRHGVNALIEIEMGAQFGGVLIKNGLPIDAWIEGFRGRSALNAILMLEEAPFVLFLLDEDASELQRPNVIGADQGENRSELSNASIPESRNLSHYDTPAVQPADPPPVPPAQGKKKKKRRRFSKTGGMLSETHVAQEAKKPVFSDTMVEETTLDDLQVQPARDRKEVISLSPNDTIVSGPPPVPSQEKPSPPSPPPIRPRRNTSDEVATASIAHVQFSGLEEKSDANLPVIDTETDFFHDEIAVDDEFNSELEEWEQELSQGGKWVESPAVAKMFLVAWLLLTVFVTWRVFTPPNAEVPDDAATEEKAVSDSADLSGLQLLGAGKLGEARTKLEKELQDKPKNIQALTGLALIAFDNKDYETSREHFLALLKADDKLERAHWYLGYIAKQAGKKEDMKRHWKQFVMATPEDKRAEAIRSELGL